MRIVALIALFLVAASPPHPIRAGDDTPADRVRDAAEMLLQERFPAFADRLAVRVMRISGTVSETDPLRLQLAASGGLPKGHAQVRLFRETAGGLRETGHAVIYVAHFDSVAVALRDLPRGAPVSAGDLSKAWIDVTEFRGTYLAAPELAELRRAGELVAERPISAGDALRVGDVRPPHAADTGSPVTMTFRRGGIRLTLACRAREPGVRGAVIRLYSDETQSTYKARLTGEGTAEWIATL